MDYRIYSMKELGEIEPDTMGYVDEDGNFWSLGKAKRIAGFFCEKSFEGMGKVAEAIALQFLNDKSKLYGSDYEINHTLPRFWPADKQLLDLGFCRFFRGFYDYEDCYEELSIYDNANLKQLYVMNYLFALNHCSSTNMENKRKELSEKLAYTIQTESQNAVVFIKK